ncbi:MAG: peptidase dimerization domain-containing protein [Candidatus Aminicenantes bacterium]|nr:MAG: peptidase dimerization domain-containing protein [Candidatus Aminicenantes bacterium]
MIARINDISRILIIVVSLMILFGLTVLADVTIQDIPKESEKNASLRKALDAEIDALSHRMFELNDWMYHNPEAGFLEFKAAAMLIEELKKHGFTVEEGVPGLDDNIDRLKVVGGFPHEYSGPPGLPTAFKAKYQGHSEHPVIGIAVEYDALRGNPPFHGCQHNMQGPTGIGAAIALTKVMAKHKIPGSVWVIGTPAEEVGPPAKAMMAQVGYLDGIDFMLRSHGTTSETLRFPGGFSARHIRQMKYTFHGKSAHAQNPWQGSSALDAVLLLFHAMDMIREHSEPQFRFHGIVSDGGAAPNIVPDMASATLWIRHLMDETPVGSMNPGKAREKIESKVDAMDNMAKGCALATGTTVDIDHYGEYNPGISIGVLNDLAFQYALEYGGVNIGEREVPRQWEETGFATLKVPGVHISIGTEGLPPAAGHSQESADITISPAGHKSLILTAKVMGAVALRLFTDEKLRASAKLEHAGWLKKYNE